MSTESLLYILDYSLSLSQVIVYFTFGWLLIKKNTHTCKRSTIEIDWRKSTQDIFIDTLIIIFYSEKCTGMKTDFLQRFIMGNFYIFSPFGSHSEYLAQFFNVIIWVLTCLLQCKIPVDSFLFNRVLKPDKLKRTFQKRNLGIFAYFWMNIIWTLWYLFISSN